MDPQQSAVLLDFDDTLLATFESRVPCVLKAASHYDYVVSLEEVMNVWGLPFRQMIETLLPGIDYGDFYSHYRSVMTEFPPVLHKGAVEFLNFANSVGLYTIVVSSSSRALVIQDLAATNILSNINSIWGHEDSKYHKPDPRVLMPILKHMRNSGIWSSMIPYIGDSVKDYLACGAYDNIVFLAVTTGQDTVETFVKAGLSSERVYGSLIELLGSEPLFQQFVSTTSSQDAVKKE